jgi:hypothetical protein
MSPLSPPPPDSDALTERTVEAGGARVHVSSYPRR